MNNIEELNRFTELDLTYKFEKEKELTDVKLKNETEKKQLYFCYTWDSIDSRFYIYLLFKKRVVSKN